MIYNIIITGTTNDLFLHALLSLFHHWPFEFDTFFLTRPVAHNAVTPERVDDFHNLSFSF